MRFWGLLEHPNLSLATSLPPANMEPQNGPYEGFCPFQGRAYRSKNLHEESYNPYLRAESLSIGIWGRSLPLIPHASTVG